MISSKDRAYLKSIMANEDTIANIGKEGLSESCLKGINDALAAREVIKVQVLQNNTLPTRQVATEIEKRLGAEIVLVVGRKIILYKYNKEKKTHVL